MLIILSSINSVATTPARRTGEDSQALPKTIENHLISKEIQDFPKQEKYSEIKQKINWLISERLTHVMDNQKGEVKKLLTAYYREIIINIDRTLSAGVTKNPVLEAYEKYIASTQTVLFQSEVKIHQKQLALDYLTKKFPALNTFNEEYQGVILGLFSQKNWEASSDKIVTYCLGILGRNAENKIDDVQQKIYQSQLELLRDLVGKTQPRQESIK